MLSLVEKMAYQSTIKSVQHLIIGGRATTVSITPVNPAKTIIVFSSAFWGTKVTNYAGDDYRGDVKITSIASSSISLEWWGNSGTERTISVQVIEFY